MLKKNTKRRKQLVDGLAAVVVIQDAAEFCFARLCRKNVEKNYVKNLIRRREVLKATSACRECACSARVSAEPNKTRNKKTERDKEEEE
jgi:hypothetical protein